METTRLSTKGQIILPKAIRVSRDWRPGTAFIVEETVDGVLLRPSDPIPLQQPSSPNLRSSPETAFEEIWGGNARTTKANGTEQGFTAGVPSKIIGRRSSLATVVGAPFYFTYIVAPIFPWTTDWPPLASSIKDQGENSNTPCGIPVGTRMFICITPHGIPGALPAYSAGAYVAGVPGGVAGLISTLMPGAMFTGPAGLRRPVAQGEASGPKPVPHMETTDPLGAGFDSPLMLPSWLMAAA